MKKYLSKILMMLVCAVFALPSQAQLLKLTVKDKALQENAMFINHGDFADVKFDANGVWTYNSDKVTKGTDVDIMLQDGGFVPAYIEPGKTVNVVVTMKKGKPQIKYSGDNVDASRYLEQSSKFYPDRRVSNFSAFEDMDDEEQREEAIARAKKEAADTITFDEAYKRLAKKYEQTMKAAKAVKNPELSKRFQKETDLTYLANRINLTQTKAHYWKTNLKKDPYYQQLMAEIDPNDEKGADQRYNLAQTFIESKLTTNRRDNDQTAYTLDYINTVERFVTNENVRHRLLGELGMNVFNSSYAGQVFEMDKFWSAFKKAAPKRTIDYFQPIYDSRMATRAGTPCPDVSFSDPQGNPHKLSEYFGKVLYIDIWATWCGPCVAEIPYIEKHVAHYKNNDKIRFISISIDSNKQAWHNKLEKDKPEWLQFLCNKEEYELITKQWGITGIPRFVIINADGTINNAEAFRPSAEDFRERIDKIIGE